MARTTHVSNEFPWSQRCSSHWSSIVCRYICRSCKTSDSCVSHETGTVAQMLEHPLCDREIGLILSRVVRLIPCRIIPKTSKNLLAALSFDVQHFLERRTKNPDWSVQCQYFMTGWNMSCAWGLIFQWQHSKRGGRAPFHILTPSRYDWNIDESDISRDEKEWPLRVKKKKQKKKKKKKQTNENLSVKCSGWDWIVFANSTSSVTV